MKRFFSRRGLLLLGLMLALVLLPSAAQAAPRVTGLCFSASSVALGFEAGNNSQELTLKSARYSNNKTHKTYGFPADISYSISNPAIASVLPTPDGVRVTANPLRASGSAIMTIKASGRTVARVSVKTSEVVKASSIRLSKSSLTLRVTSQINDPLNPSETYALTHTILPMTASANLPGSALYTYESSRPSVVTVDPATGQLHALKQGSATVRLKLLDGSKRYASCRVTVKALAPGSVALDVPRELTLERGGQIKLTPTVLPATVLNKGVTFSSSNNAVATVTSAGTLKAVKNGKATISVKTRSGSQKYSVKLSVVTKNFDPDTQVRFYGVANGKYSYASDIWSYSNDLSHMSRAYAAASFGGKKVERHLKKNLTGSGIKGLLAEITNNTAIGANDITIFYYSGHGDENGSLVGVDTREKKPKLVTVDTVKSYLDRVPGTVIVMFDSCYSGQFIEAKSGAASAKSASIGAVRFNASVVNAFKQGKPAGIVRSKSLVDSGTPAGSYKILTACAPTQESYFLSRPNQIIPCSFFTWALWNGAQRQNGIWASADVNKDELVTLGEMYDYSSAMVNEMVDWVSGEMGEKLVPQTVMVWPANDQTPVYALN